MAGLQGRKIVLGVTGGIAAYKAVELASRLTKAGAEVHVLMSRAAKEFVTELTFREITGNPVASDMWAKNQEFHVEHIALARLAELVIVAPATANLVAKMAAGLADDLLSTTLIATKAPIFLAPAMNTGMYENPATQHNLEVLRGRGVHIIEPASGHLACGVEGKGRLPEAVELAGIVENFFASCGSLKGRKLIVTAGGTREPIDPVRYIGNHSSGKMGYAVAAEAARRGAEVVLVSGPTALPDPSGVRCVRINTALEMREAVQREYADTDAVVMSAAVADYHVKDVAAQKIKKSDDNWQIVLERNPDILKELGATKKPHQVLVGFAAETCNLMEYARRKLEQKNLDYIVANDVTREGAGFQGETNVAVIISRDGTAEELPLMQKSELACRILDKVEAALGTKNS